MRGYNLTDAPRHPRAVRELQEAEAEVVILITGADALLRLTEDCKFPEAQARRVLNIAWEFGQKAEPCPGGYVHVWYHGIDDTKQHIFSVVEHLGPDAERKARKGLAQPAEKSYTQRKQSEPSGDSRERKDKKMARTAAAETPARRGRKPAAPVEPEANGDMTDEERGEAAQRYLTKPFTPTMEDYVEWFETYVSPLADLRKDLPRILVLGIQLYGLYFQKSPFNRERTAERRAERASAAAPEPVQPARPARGRKPATATTAAGNGTPAGRGRKPAAAKDEPATPARRGRPPKAAAAAAPAKAATGTRGTRGRKPATAGKDAPF